MRVWLPAIRGRSGVDVFIRRLADALRRKGLAADVSWFSGACEFVPHLLGRVPPPPGTTVIHANSWSAFAFKRGSIPLVVTEQLGVLDPYGRAYKSVLQLVYHQTLLRPFIKASFRSASAVTAVSAFTAQGLRRGGIGPATAGIKSQFCGQIIRFSNNASQLGSQPLPATADNIRLALAYVKDLRGSGGTMMIEGIKALISP